MSRPEAHGPGAVGPGVLAEDLTASRRLANAIVARWARGAPPDTRAALAAHPELEANRSVVLDLAYEEYCRRREAGDSPDPDAFCERFPTCKTSLRNLISAHRFMEESSLLSALEAAVSWPETGDEFLGFTLRSPLGRGAFAQVFLATEAELGDRAVALKISAFGSAEAAILGRLRHDNIVPVYSVRRDLATGLTAVVMPYLGGATLCDVLDRAFKGTFPTRARVILEAARQGLPAGDLTPDRHPPDRLLERGTYVDGVIRLGVQLADALALTHGQGVLHRDLKPSNILLTPDGKPMLLDFNLSSDPRGSDQRLGGTLPYMAPEHLRATDPDGGGDASQVDARSDLFALGVILFELLTGAHPFGPIPGHLTFPQLRDYLQQRQLAGPRPLRQANPQVDRPLARLIESCLAFDKARRPQSAVDLAAALRRSLSRWRRGWRWAVRHRRLVAGALVLALAVGAGAGYRSAQPDPQLKLRWEAGLAAQDRQQYGEAAAHFDWLLQAARGNPRLSFARGQARLQEAIGRWTAGEEPWGLFRQAQDDFRAARAAIPDGRIDFCIGLCYSFMSHSPEAAIAYEQALDAGFAPPALLNNLAHAYWCRGRPGDLERALQLLDQTPVQQRDVELAVHYNRARVRLRTLVRPHDHPDSDDEADDEPARDDPAAVEAMIADIRRAAALTPRDPRAVAFFAEAAYLTARAARCDDRWDDLALEYAQLAASYGRDPKVLKKTLMACSQKAGLPSVGTILVGGLGAPQGQGTIAAAAILLSGKARKPLFESLPDQGRLRNPAQFLCLVDPIAGIPQDLRWRP
jgi:serine/threonine protein kinase